MPIHAEGIPQTVGSREPQPENMSTPALCAAPWHRIAPTRSKEQEGAVDKPCRCVDYSRRGVVAGQPVHSHGIQHQNDSECLRSCGGLCLVAASDRDVGERNQFPAAPLIGPSSREAAAISAARICGTPLRNQRVVVFGAGTAGIGIADPLRDAMVREGLIKEDAPGGLGPAARRKPHCRSARRLSAAASRRRSFAI